MTKIIFKNLQNSEMAKTIVLNKIAEASAKFPELARHKISATLTMDNSRTQAGRDDFSLKLMINGRIFKNLVLEKHAETLYEAVAAVYSVLTERLNRVVSKKRGQTRAQARRFQYKESWEHWYESAA
jgi:ribosome-associated translation inhibitor RaiA